MLHRHCISLSHETVQKLYILQATTSLYPPSQIYPHKNSSHLTLSSLHTQNSSNSLSPPLFLSHPMEALWNMEDKWKITTQEAVFVFTCTAFLVSGICLATAIKRRARRRQLVSQEPSGEDEAEAAKCLEPRPGGCGSVKRALVGSVRWSNARKWEERGSSRSRKERATPLLVGRGKEGEVGWQSHNSVAPVWQRPILMGEKCELPRFSGLILYDERGRPVRNSGIGTTDHQGRINAYTVHNSRVGTTDHQEITITVQRTTLRDLL